MGQGCDLGGQSLVSLQLNGLLQLSSLPRSRGIDPSCSRSLLTLKGSEWYWAVQREERDVMLEPPGEVLF